MKSPFWLFIFIAPLFLAACISSEVGVVIEESQGSLQETRHHIAAILGEPKDVSENGREVFSNYFSAKGVYIAPQDNVKERFFSHILILGERRPYDIDVRVYRETRRKNGLYIATGLDMAQSKKLALKLKAALNESREKRNVIDDFQAF